jgi:ubiquinone/menaquinone biosynthesis C-methylase UbiE
MSDWWKPFVNNEKMTASFKSVYKDIPELEKKFKKRKVKRILDIAFGSGRHIVFFAKHGYDVYGFDNSQTAQKLTEKKLKQEHLKAHLLLSDMNIKFPYKNGFFDAEIAISAIEHTTYTKLKKVTKEMRRVLKKGGVIFISVPAEKKLVRSKMIDYRTQVPLEGMEKGIPHFYFNKAEIRKLFYGFDLKIKKIMRRENKGPGGRLKKRFIIIGIKK